MRQTTTILAVVAIFLMSITCFMSEPARGSVLLEDGEGATATLDAKYAKASDALRVAQIVTEESIVPQAGTGAAKYVFSVDSNDFVSVFTRNFISPQNASAEMSGALEFWFYYPGANFADRSQGKTLDTLEMGFSDGNVNQGFKIWVVDREGASPVILHGLQSNAWNRFHIELNEQGRFSSIGSTVNGAPVQTSSANIATTFTGLGSGTNAQVATMWSGLTSFYIQDTHGGGPGVEGFYGMDDMQLIPEPSSAVLLLVVGLISQRRRST